jgi:hypothetical protein
MKKNLFLIGLLSALISLAYVWEHLEIKEKFKAENNLEKLLKLKNDDVVEISLKNSKLLKKDGQWIVGELNYSADNSKIKILLGALAGLSIVSEITLIETKPADEYFLHQDHTFQVKTFSQDYSFRLGDVSPITGNFYLESYSLGQKKLFLVRNTNVYEGLYRNELESEFQKYLVLKNLVTAMPMDLIEAQFYPQLALDKIENIKIDNRINRWFELNFLNSDTQPKIYPGLEYKNLKQQFEKLWFNVKIEKFFELGKHVLSEKLSTIEIKLHDSSVKFTLYGLMNDIPGYYAVIENEARIYQLDEKSRDFFFANVQDFWWKQHFSKTLVNSLTKLDFKLGLNGHFYSFEVPDIKLFEVRSHDLRVNSVNAGNMNLLFNLIFNLVEFEEAKFIQQEFTKAQVDSISFDLELLDKKFKVRFLEYLIIVQDLSGKLEFAYPHRIPGIHIKQLTDFFTLK